MESLVVRVPLALQEEKNLGLSPSAILGPVVANCWTQDLGHAGQSLELNPTFA